MAGPRIFVSHSHKNNDFGLKLVGDLRTRLGEDAVWYDASGGLHGGDEWWNMILRELASRDTFIVILSPDAVASQWVQDEMSIAWRLRHEVGMRIIPVLLESTPRRVDYALLQEVAFVAPRPYAEGLAELLGLLGVTANQQPTPVATPTDPRSQLARRLTDEIHTALGRQDWVTMVSKSDLLLAEAPDALTPPLWRERAYALLTLGQPGPALDALEAALRADPYDVPTLRTKVRALMAANRVAEAQTTLARAFAIAPLDDPATRLDLLAEQFAMQMHAGAFQAALATATDALQLAPNDPTWQARRTKAQTAIDAAEFARQQQAEDERHAHEEEVHRQEAARLAEQQRQEQILKDRLRTLGFILLNEKNVIVPPTVIVPTGTFQMGGDKDSFNSGIYLGTVSATVTLSSFRVSIYPITVAEWACAVNAKVVPEPHAWAYQKLDHPVVFVSWFDVQKYTIWLSQQTGQKWRLPTEAEWEYTARGTDRRIYPWGNMWDKNRANTKESGLQTTTPVGSFAQRGDTSPFGVHDMSGNIWELTSTPWSTYTSERAYNIGIENVFDVNSPRVQRGGSFWDDAQKVRVASRHSSPPTWQYYNLGARLVLDVGPEQ